MNALDKMHLKRALIDGAIAQQAGYPMIAPSNMGEFERSWLEGWQQASQRNLLSGSGNEQSAKPRGN